MSSETLWDSIETKSDLIALTKPTLIDLIEDKQLSPTKANGSWYVKDDYVKVLWSCKQNEIQMNHNQQQSNNNNNNNNNPSPPPLASPSPSESPSNRAFRM